MGAAAPDRGTGLMLRLAAAGPGPWQLESRLLSQCPSQPECHPALPEILLGVMLLQV